MWETIKYMLDDKFAGFFVVNRKTHFHAKFHMFLGLYPLVFLHAPLSSCKMTGPYKSTRQVACKRPSLFGQIVCDISINMASIIA